MKRDQRSRALSSKLHSAFYRFATFRFYFALIVLISALSMGGCTRGNGKITVSTGIAQPLRQVEDINKRGIAKLNDLDARGLLDPAQVSSSQSQSEQIVTRFRAATQFDASSPTQTLAIPTLPDADKSALASAQFSPLNQASALGAGIKPSPFFLISDTTDINDSLIPAHLKYKYTSLLADGYEFFYVPVSVSILPGSRTRYNNLADVHFSANVSSALAKLYNFLDEKKGDVLMEMRKSIQEKIEVLNLEESATPQKELQLQSLTMHQNNIQSLIDLEKTQIGELEKNLEIQIAPLIESAKKLNDTLANDSPETFLVNANAAIVEINAIENLNASQIPHSIKSITGYSVDELKKEIENTPELALTWKQYKDLRVFTLLPLRQNDRRQEFLANRLQTEWAFQLSATGPISQAVQAAINASIDRVKRLEQDLAMVSRLPIIAGYMNGAHEFGWQFYPTAQIDRRRFQPQYTLLPGARDLIAVIAVKRAKDKRDESISIPIIAEGRFRHIHRPWWRKFLLWRETEVRPENGWNKTRNNTLEQNYWSSFGQDEGERGRFDVSILLPPAQTLKINSIIDPITGHDFCSNSNAQVDGRKPFLLEIKGHGFNDSTRIVYKGQQISPISINYSTADSMFALLPAEEVKAPASGNPAPVKQTIYLTNAGLDHSKVYHLTITPGTKKTPPPPSPEFALSNKPSLITPGQFLTIQYTKPATKTAADKTKPNKLTNADVNMIKIVVGGTIEITPNAVNLDSGVIGFTTPVLTPGLDRVVSVVLTVNDGSVAKAFDLGQLLYTNNPQPPSGSISVKLVP